MRDQIRRDMDSTESALQLMAMRTELATLVADWRAAGGSEPLPTIQERLKANHRPAQKPKTAIWFCSIATSPGSGATSGFSLAKSSS